MKTQNKTAREKIIETIDKPLGFFVLALLIVETFLALVLVYSKFDAEKQFTGMLWGIGLFFFVVLTVTILVWFKPENLTYDKAAHLANKKLNAPYGTEKKEIKNIDNLLSTDVKSK
jgi:hypothetical protein